MTQTNDDSYPAEWLTPSQRQAVDAAHGLDDQLDSLDDDQLLEVLNRTLAKRRKPESW